MKLRTVQWCSAFATIALLVLTFSSANASTFYWLPTSIGLPSNPDVEALAINPTTPSVMYAGTFGDGIYKSVDHGATWITASTGITLPMYVQNALAVDPLSPSYIYAGEYYGDGLYRSSNGGTTWSQVLPGASIRAVASSPITPGLVLVGDRYEGLYRSLDYGSTWKSISNTAGLTDTYVSAIAFNPTTPYTTYVGAMQSVFASADGGLTWHFKSELPSNVYSLAASPQTPGLLLAGTYGDGVYKSTNDGRTWSASNMGLLPNAWVTSLAFDPFTPTIVYLGTWDGQVYRSEGSGTGWSSLGNLGNIYAVAVHPAAQGIILAGTSNNGLFRGSTLDDITVEPIAAIQYISRPFTLTVTARDALGLPLSGGLSGGYNGVAILTDTARLISPTTMSLVNGVGALDVVFNKPVLNDMITVTLQAEGLTATSNKFDIRLALYLPMVLR